MLIPRLFSIVAIPAVLALTLCLLLPACGPGPAPEGKGPTKSLPIAVQLDWVAEPEHGAFYMAQAKGYFVEENLDVTLLQGGLNAFSIEKVASGQAQFGQSDSTTVLVAISKKLPLINVGAIFQNDPTVLMMHESNPVQDWPDLEGRPVMVRPESAFVPFVKRKYGIDFPILTQTFDLTQLTSDPKFIQQGFYIAEPYFVEQKGVKLKYLYVWDAGFDAYTTIFANTDFLRAHPGEARAFLRALKRGYRDYIESDPTPAHEMMKKVNPKVDDAYLEFSRSMIIKAGLADTDHLSGDKMGYLSVTAARYRRQIEQLEDLATIAPGSVTVEQAVDLTLLPPPGP